MLSSFKKLLKKIHPSAWIDTLYPRHCSCCNTALRGHTAWHALCANCAQGIIYLEGPACSICAKPFHGIVAGEQRCAQCIEALPQFDRVWALLEFSHTGRKLVHTLKYRHGHYVLPDIEKITLGGADFLKRLEGCALVPIPLHPLKQWMRGYNQSQWLAELWQKSAPQAYIENCLKRTRYTTSQIHLSREKRQVNVKNAFALKRSETIDPKQTYILIDDVFTTGSTVNACAKLLKKAGATRVEVAVLCHD